MAHYASKLTLTVLVPLQLLCCSGGGEVNPRFSADGILILVKHLDSETALLILHGCALIMAKDLVGSLGI